MRQKLLIGFVASAAAAAAASAALGSAAGARHGAGGTCSPGFVAASLSWGNKCLRAGEFCKVGEAEYHRYGFDCPASGHLVAARPGSPGASAGGAAPAAAGATVTVGSTVLLARRTRTSGCVRGAEPDRRCSPGAYASGLTTAVLCSPGFRTSAIRDVPQSEKFAVEAEYGLAPGFYGHEIEIDHIVPLELGGSNDIANLFPEPGSGARSYRVKDALENRLHDLVCSGAIALRSAQRAIATDWVALYARVFGDAPAGRP